MKRNRGFRIKKYNLITYQLILQRIIIHNDIGRVRLV